MNAERIAEIIGYICLSVLILVLISLGDRAPIDFLANTLKLIVSGDNSLAYATWALFIATLVLASIAYMKLGAAAKQQRIWSTLQACDRYDTDLTLNRNIRRLMRHLEYDRPLDDEQFNAAATNLFNYFDAIAIGIKHKMYDEEIVQAHLGNVIRNWIECRFMPAVTGGIDKTAINFWDKNVPHHYEVFCELYRKWNPSSLFLEEFT